jgi:hypothetical protein
MTTALILAGEVIVAVASLVETREDAIVTPDGVFPFAAGVTGTQTVDSLPADFRADRYVWRGGALVRLPDPPPPTQAEIDAVTEARRVAYTAESDHLFMAWQASTATDAADQDAKKQVWLAARDAVRTRLPYPS